MKKISLVFLGLLAIMGITLALNLSSVIKRIIETAGTQAVGTSVSVSGLNVSLADRKASIRGLSVGNPKGFKTDDLLKATEISVAVGDMTDKTVVIKDILVDGMTVTYELASLGTNFDAMQRNLKSSMRAGNEADKSSGKGSSPDVIIQHLKIIHARVIPALAGVQTPINLPDITLNNIGSKSSPATPTQVAVQVMNQVLAVSSLAVVRSGLAAPVNAAVTKAKDQLKGLFSK